jgi:hypothetical protein
VEANKVWVDTGGWGMSGVIEFSNVTSSWTWTCIWGCSDWDHEGEQEAREALLRHVCPMDS